MPILSVIIPVYNDEKYLVNCLKSISKQDVVDMEVICVNNGSTDSSGKILDEYVKTDSRFRAIHQENLGVSVARNTGLDVATGTYVIFVDGDDQVGVESGATGHEFQRMLDVMTPEVDFAVGGIKVVYEANEHMRESDERYYRLPFIGRHKITDVEIMSAHCSPCGKCYRRSIIEKHKLRFPVGLHYEDAYWHFCYMAVAPNGFGLNETVYIYYRHPSGIMNATFNKKDTDLAVQHIYIAEETYKFYKKEGLVEQKESLLIRLFELYYKLACRFSNEEDWFYVMWRMEKILRKNDINVNTSRLLSMVKNGGDYMFESSMVDPSVHRHAEKYLKYKKVLSTVFFWMKK